MTADDPGNAQARPDNPAATDIAPRRSTSTPSKALYTRRFFRYGGMGRAANADRGQLATDRRPHPALAPPSQRGHAQAGNQASRLYERAENALRVAKYDLTAGAERGHDGRRSSSVNSRLGSRCRERREIRWRRDRRDATIRAWMPCSARG